MAEKRVSVRLSAVNGRQVRAELTGVGEAGARGFKRVSREVEMANARLAAFARRARIAARIAAASVAAAGVAMVRSGLQTIDAQAKLAHSFGTTTESVQVLARAAELSGSSMQTLQTGFRTFTVGLSQFAQDGTGPAARAIKALHLNATELLRLPLDKRIAVVTDAIRKYGDASQQAAMFSQLFGSRGFVAFTRLGGAIEQARNDVDDFGVGVSDLDASQVERTNDAITRLGLVWRGLSNHLTVAAAPALEAVADAMAAVSKTTGPLGFAIQALVDSIGQIAAISGTFATFLAGRWVAGMVAAAASTATFSGALVVLRGALIRTGIGALIVGAGELVYWFTRLVSSTGDFGRSLALMGDVAAGVWTGLEKLLESFAFKFAAMSTNVEAKWIGLIASLENRWVKFLESINNFQAFGNQIFHLDLGPARAELENLLETQNKLNDQISAWDSQAANRYKSAFDNARKSLAALLAAMKKSDSGMDASISAAKTLAEALEPPPGDGGGGGGGGGGNPGTPALTPPPLTGWDATMAALKNWMDQAQDWGKNLGSVLVGAFRGAENAIHRFVETGKMDFKGLLRSILADLATMAVRRSVLMPLASALFGGLFAGGSGRMTGQLRQQSRMLRASIHHAGGIVGLAGVTRPMPALAFAGAPRMHNGGWVGLRHDEVPTILQRGERVLSRREAASGAATKIGDIHVTVNGARGNAEIREMVGQGVKQGIAEYDRVVGERVQNSLKRKGR